MNNYLMDNYLMNNEYKPDFTLYLSSLMWIQCSDISHFPENFE